MVIENINQEINKASSYASTDNSWLIDLTMTDSVYKYIKPYNLFNIFRHNHLHKIIIKASEDEITKFMDWDNLHPHLEFHQQLVVVTTAHSEFVSCANKTEFIWNLLFSSFKPKLTLIREFDCANGIGYK